MITYGALAWSRKTRSGDNPVPCGDCSACCRDLRAVLDPAVDKGSYTVHQRADGSCELARKADGTCVYLQGSRCAIYAHRPTVCRAFDCRALLVADVHEPLHVWDAASKQFQILAKEPDDAAWLARVRQKAIDLAASGTPTAQIVSEALA